MAQVHLNHGRFSTALFEVRKRHTHANGGCTTFAPLQTKPPSLSSRQSHALNTLTYSGPQPPQHPQQGCRLLHGLWLCLMIHPPKVFVEGTPLCGWLKGKPSNSQNPRASPQGDALNHPLGIPLDPEPHSSALTWPFPGPWPLCLSRVVGDQLCAIFACGAPATHLPEPLNCPIA